MEPEKLAHLDYVIAAYAVAAIILLGMAIASWRSFAREKKKDQKPDA